MDDYCCEVDTQCVRFKKIHPLDLQQDVSKATKVTFIYSFPLRRFNGAAVHISCPSHVIKCSTRQQDSLIHSFISLLFTFNAMHLLLLSSSPFCWSRDLFRDKSHNNENVTMNQLNHTRTGVGRT